MAAYLSRVGAALAVTIVAACGASAARAQLWASSLAGTANRIDVSPISPANGAAGTSFPINGGAGMGVSDLAGDPLWQGVAMWGVRGVATTGTINYLAAWNPVAKALLSETQINVSSPVRTLAIDPTDGRFYATTDANLYRLDPVTAQATLVGTTSGISVNSALGFDGLGQLYGVSANNQLVSLDKATGATSLVATMSVLTIADIAWRADTSVMLGIGLFPTSVEYKLFEINLATGAIGILGSSLTRPSGLAFTGLAADFDRDGTVALADFEIWRTHAGTTGTQEHGDANGDGAINGADYLAWQRQLGSTVNPPPAVVVPEPGGAVLLAVVMLVLSRRR